MRKIININSGWKFFKADVGIEKVSINAGEAINLPHTWNNKDGQDGGNNYYRGKCWYVREFKKPTTLKGEQVYLEFKGVNSTAEVFVNGNYATSHSGGYSTFRKNITAYLQEDNILAVSVDNSKNETVYPQTADFTFYGGIYRDVNIIIASCNHFDLDFYGGSGVKITPSIKGKNGVLQIETFVIGRGEVYVTVFNACGETVCKSVTNIKPIYLNIADVHLWGGRLDPYLYTVKLELISEGVVEDEVVKNIGFREFYVDSNLGFFLNGKKYPLRGVCRHQDRPNIGNALLKQHHDEDIKLIAEVGANTIRLAHYQHDDYFYDLCDSYGFIVWAEIPYISRHMSGANDNATSQMKELIYQQYHHASIVCWGLSNEITMRPSGEDRYNFHIKLNELCHELDPTRKTAMACYMPCSAANRLNRIPDLVSYNLYFGWYFPITALAGWKLDSYHKKYPNERVGLAEYGAEAMPNIHSERAWRGDNSEEYQAIYHEKMLKIIEKREFIWATHLWNMFDFSADARNQGGEAGMNHKGLVTFDRKIKKDAFYLYKAYWSSEPFIHICGKRFVNRTGKTSSVKVYSNSRSVELFNNGKRVDMCEGDKIFCFKIELQPTNKIVAKSGELSDTAIVNKVKKKDKAYLLKKTKNKSWEK